MRLAKSKNVHAAAPLSLPMAGMIDVVFLLLIFFLVTASFHTPENSMTTRISSSGEANAANLQPVPIRIRLSHQQSVTTFQFGGVTTDDHREVIETLASIASDTEPIFVEVAAEVPYQDALYLIADCHNRGFKNIVYQPAP